MCDATVIAIATTVVSTAMSVAQQQQQAKAQKRANRIKAEHTRQAAVNAYSSKLSELVQEREKASMQLAKVKKQELRDLAKARVLGGESGVNTAALERDIGGEAGDRRNEINKGHDDATFAALRGLSEIHDTAAQNLERLPEVMNPALGIVDDISSGVGALGRILEKHENKPTSAQPGDRSGGTS